MTIEVIIGVPKMRNIQVEFDHGEYFSCFKIGDKNLTLKMEPDVPKYRFVKSGTYSEDFTSDTDIVPETSSEEKEEDTVGTYFNTVRDEHPEKPDEDEAERENNLDILRENMDNL